MLDTEGWEIGLRTDDRAVGSLWMRLFDGSLRPASPAPPGYSVVANPVRVEGVAGTPLGELRQGPAVMFRSRSPRRLGLAAAAYATSHVRAGRSALRLTMAAVVSGDRCVLLPTARLHAPGLEARLARDDVVIIDTPTVEIVDGGRLEAVGWSTIDDDRRSVSARPVRILLDPHELRRFGDERSGHLAAVARRIQPSALDPQARLERAAAVLAAAELSLLDARSPSGIAASILSALRH